MTKAPQPVGCGACVAAGIATGSRTFKNDLDLLLGRLLGSRLLGGGLLSSGLLLRGHSMLLGLCCTRNATARFVD